MHKVIHNELKERKCYVFTKIFTKTNIDKFKSIINGNKLLRIIIIIFGYVEVYNTSLFYLYFGNTKYKGFLSIYNNLGCIYPKMGI